METAHQYVIVGSSRTGVSAAEGIRERDRSNSVLPLGREPDRLYDRPSLTKPLLREEAQVRLPSNASLVRFGREGRPLGAILRSHRPPFTGSTPSRSSWSSDTGRRGR
jgi:hypothetical protein